MAKITFVRLFIAIAAIHHWSLYQLDIKNVFLHSELEEEIYMEQPLGFDTHRESLVWFADYDKLFIGWNNLHELGL